MLLTKTTSIKRKKKKNSMKHYSKWCIYIPSIQNTISLLNGANKFNLKN